MLRFLGVLFTAGCIVFLAAAAGIAYVVWEPRAVCPIIISLPI